MIRPGLNLEGHAAPDAVSRREEGLAPGREVTIGYFSRVAPEKGLHQLAEALVLLARQADLPPVRVTAAGYLAAADRPYLEKIQTHLAEHGLAQRFTYQGEMDRPGKIAFLQSLDMMCLPTVYQESKALPVLEAWANGVPVVVPDHGTFPELVADTGGGLLYQAGDPAALAEALARLIRDPPMGTALGPRVNKPSTHGTIPNRWPSTSPTSTLNCSPRRRTSPLECGDSSPLFVVQTLPCCKKR